MNEGCIVFGDQTPNPSPVFASVDYAKNMIKLYNSLDYDNQRFYI